MCVGEKTGSGLAFAELETPGGGGTCGNTGVELMRRAGTGHLGIVCRKRRLKP